MEIYVINQVKEFVGNGQTVKACLVHVSFPKEILKTSDNYLSIQIIDTDGNLGQAATFFTLNK